MVDVQPDQVHCECPFCREDWYADLAEVQCTTHRCYGGMDTDAYHAVGSAGHLRALVGDIWESRGPESIRRQRRGDYWNVVTHYTQPEAFIGILRSGRIKAHPTGYFGSARRPPEERERSRAVCLTETPWKFADEIRDRFGHFGFAFERSKLKTLGCGPVLNVPSLALRRHMAAVKRDQKGASRVLHGGWHRDLVPFINTISHSFNFLPEREWRVPVDIRVTEYRPWLLLPDDHVDVLRGCGASTKELATWLCEFGRARIVGPDHWLYSDDDDD